MDYIHSLYGMLLLPLPSPSLSLLKALMKILACKAPNTAHIVSSSYLIILGAVGQKILLQKLPRSSPEPALAITKQCERNEGKSIIYALPTPAHEYSLLGFRVPLPAPG